MSKKVKKKTYRLDNSAIIHLASLGKNYSNTFRLTVTLKEKISTVMLQNAVHNITPRFPTIVAGIKRGLFDYFIEPVDAIPKIQFDSEYLAYMSLEMLENCAIRILYNDYQISVEFSHAITDGYGGLIFIKSLVAEYLTLHYSVEIPYADEILNPLDSVKESEVKDDYITYKGKKVLSANSKNTFQLVKNDDVSKVIQKRSGIYDLQKITESAHCFGASLTTYMTSVMAKVLLEIQATDFQKMKKPIQIMVPINLRRRFASNSIRNFSLYALPCVVQENEHMELQKLINKISKQLEEQLTEPRLRGMMATNVNLQQLLLFRILPLPVKNILLKLVFRFFGERNSCITISNLGEITFPDEVKRYVEEVDFMLSPRKVIPINCSVFSYNGKLYINFTSKCKVSNLEKRFFEMLDENN